MKINYYTADTLRRELDAFEARYGYSSEEHVRRRYSDGDQDAAVSGFDSHVWADVYHEWQRIEKR